MRLFASERVKKSIDDFDNELGNYFSTARKYRSSIRRGSIVILDNNDSLFRLLTFLTEKCNLRGGVVHVDRGCCAKKAVEDIGPEKVKAIVIDENMLGESMNGDSFTQWLSDNYPNIPVWVANCDKEREAWIKNQTRKVGTLDKEESLASIAEAIGLGDCEDVLKDYNQ